MNKFQILLIIAVSLSVILTSVLAASSLNSPSACSGKWNNCVRAFANDANRATASATSTTNKTGTWNNYGFSITNSSTIDNVTVRADFFASNKRGYINVKVSGDGGATFGPSHVVGGNTAEKTFLINVTSDTTWTPAKLSNANLRVQATCFKQGSGSNPTCRLDWIPVQVDSTQFDFAISVNPVNGTVIQGGSTNTTVTAALLGGISQPVSLSQTGCPVSATCSFTPASGNPPFASTLNIVTTNATTPGTYQINVTGTGDGKTRSAMYTLTVNSSPFDFAVSVNPSNGTVVQGNNASTTTTVSLISGVSQLVVLTSSECPPSAICFSSPSSGNPTFTSTFNVITNSTTPLGTHIINVTGTGDGKTKTATYILNVVSGSAPASLVAEWKFEDNTLDTSGNNHHGTLVAGASFDAGIVGRGLRIDGATGYVTVPYSPQFDLPVAGTISLWHNLSPTQPQFPGLISRGENGDTNNNFEIYLNPVGSPTYRYAAHISNGQSQFCSVTDPALLDDQWHHVVLTWDGTSCKLFLDGVLKSQGPQTFTTAVIGAQPVVIGALTVTDSRVHPNGVLDQIRIFNGALSQGEINSLFDEGGLTPPVTTEFISGTIYASRTIKQTGMSCPTSFNDAILAVPSQEATATASDQTGDFGCRRSLMYFDTTSIPDTAQIIDVKIRWDGEPFILNPRNCDWNAIQINPGSYTSTDPTTAESIWNDIGDGTNFVSDDANCTIIGTDIMLDLGSLSDTDLQNHLVDNWWAVGFKLNSEVRDNVYHIVGLANPEIQVTYIP